MTNIKNVSAKIKKMAGEENYDKAVTALNKKAKSASSKIGVSVNKKVSAVSAQQVEKKLNKYIDKYIK